MTTTLKIEGMSCEHCVRAVQNAVLEVAGVETVQVDLEQKTAVVEYGGDAALEAAKAAIEEEGYQVAGTL